MKKLTIHCFAAALVLTCGVFPANAQVAYSMHTLGKGETLSQLSKTYHTSVGDIMRLNGMNAQSQLHVGDKIKIPAGGTVAPPKMEAAPVSAAAPQTSTAKTHMVAPKETLFHISQVYNIPVERLKVINNLPDGAVKVGQTLLVSEGSAPQTPQPVQKEKLKADAAVSGSSPDAAKKRVPAESTGTIPDYTEEKRKPATPDVTTKPVSTATPPVTSQTAVQLASQNSTADNSTPLYTTVNVPAEGYFSTLYGRETGGRHEQIKEGASMTFKSASGWADKKYYILMNDAPTGSIVKIRNGKNELFAKVLWNLGEMKENDGLSFRISTATAAALGITDQKFDLKVSYFD